MDSSGGLYTLPSEALSILRFFASSGTEAAHTEAIIEGTGLSDRGFGKGIRRLVTRNYLTLSGEQVYRLTDQGRRSIRELVEDAETFGEEDDYDSETFEIEPRFVRRTLILVAPSALAAEREQGVVVAFDASSGQDDTLENPTELLLRFSVINGEPTRSQEVSVQLGNGHSQYNFQVTPGAYTRARLRAEVFQLKDAEEVEFCGGLFIDLPVQREIGDAVNTPAAYGVDVILREISA